MAARKESTGESIYQIKVTLRDTRPPIWRRFHVPSDITLHDLHRVLQVVMGWSGYHLHQFIIGGEYYGEPDPEYDISETKEERAAKLSQVVPGEKARFIYEYDFGDGWEHALLVEKVLPRDEGVQYPVCLAGRRACPPEDCGGTPGYADFLEAIKNPSGKKEQEEWLEWVGEDFDPEAFDLHEVNEELKGIGGLKRIK